MYYKRIFVKYCIKVYNEVIGNYLGVYSMFMEEDFKIISENINKCTININNKNNVLSDKYLLRNKSNNKHVDILKIRKPIKRLIKILR